MNALMSFTGVPPLPLSNKVGPGERVASEKRLKKWWAESSDTEMIPKFSDQFLLSAMPR